MSDPFPCMICRAQPSIACRTRHMNRCRSLLEASAFYIPRIRYGQVLIARHNSVMCELAHTLWTPGIRPDAAWAAPYRRLQTGQRWTGHPVDSALSWAQVDHIDGPLHGARAGSVQGFLERLTRPSRYTHLAALALQSTQQSPLARLSSLAVIP